MQISKILNVSGCIRCIISISDPLSLGWSRIDRTLAAGCEWNYANGPTGQNYFDVPWNPRCQWQNPLADMSKHESQMIQMIQMSNVSMWQFGMHFKKWNSRCAATAMDSAVTVRNFAGPPSSDCWPWPASLHIAWMFASYIQFRSVQCVPFTIDKLPMHFVPFQKHYVFTVDTVILPHETTCPGQLQPQTSVGP